VAFRLLSLLPLPLPLLLLLVLLLLPLPLLLLLLLLLPPLLPLLMLLVVVSSSSSSSLVMLWMCARVCRVGDESSSHLPGTAPAQGGRIEPHRRIRRSVRPAALHHALLHTTDQCALGTIPVCLKQFWQQYCPY
jgi:hypothetical protein